ncbi:bifunctional sugar-1-phosphate nucleotidylyltransferase/acetyltransferase [Acidianus ambivalens]|uniref:NTP transferase domain-containing protein n=1 Tax=Acidianus ambivalens TaxID=2283 RepID=A0A650CXS4_ACIAM|nr:bifunctional sugar-1-phosphate nucleotidylyltransferase/acetyltransferase [Acidianus ambivalens]MQL54817.1 NTP transferase domain-containing protein [Acidianus ambivalens]QGR22606.1 NTP transferase domain-containing protein [Acidianus ambivalens]
MQVVILAAGKGERLEPITHTRPKPFVPLLGSTLIERTINSIKERNIGNEILVVIPSDYPEEYKEFYSRLKDVKLVKQKTDYGTASALLSVREAIKDEEFLLIYGDILVDENAIEKVSSAAHNAILGVKVNNPRDFGVLNISEDGYLKNILEKPQNPPSNLINGGIYKLSSKIFEYIDKISKSIRGEYELTDAINLFSIENKIEIIKYDGLWMDIGKPWDIIDANKVLLDIEKPRILGEVEDGVKIKGKVIIEEGARVLHGTYIEGPVFIGKNSIIGPNSYLRPYTVLCGNNKIGASVEVKESVIMENTKVPHLSYVGDSVISEDVNFGAGTLVANLRFDEAEVKVFIKGERVSSGRKKLGTFIGAHVRTGINVSILPGVKIGAYAKIYPGAVVNRDVKKGEFYKG